ncbi:MAG: arginine--tRNA ligase [Sedimentisphaerales bacterium]|nr:arginine--tRNA ligase [Sedimentisphaerales bacterium]
MQSVLDILEKKISSVMAEVTGQGGCPALVKPATDPRFGDYQVNGVMPLAKQLKTNPRKLAEQIVAKLVETSSIEHQVSSIEVAGPGFINLRLKPEFVAENFLQVSKDPARLGIEKTEKPKTIVVDFSGPNIAKQMHVGHLRSTIIGDCICRLLEFEGHTVIRQNHIGDWGTHFGMLICYFFQKFPDASIEKLGPSIGVVSGISVADMNIPDMEAFYREAKKIYDSDTAFASKSREYVVKLQSGDPKICAIWQFIRSQSLYYSYDLYHKLNVTLSEKHVRGESEYNNDLPEIVKELKKKGLAVESEGAICVFPEGFKDKEGKPLPVLVQKSDEAYLYATTDLAAIRYRVGELKADEIIYVTDARQSLHFDMVFAVAEKAGWAKREMLHHVTFGSVLGENGKPLKTRSGENVKLKELLDEAVERARKIVNEKNPVLTKDEKDRIAKAVGIGAVKYADYSNNRTSDYIFSFNKMLAMEGNTAPYMQYAYARVKSINRKGGERGIDVEKEMAGLKAVSLTEPSELDLAKHLIRYGEAVEAALADYRPNYLTSYLYDLAQKFSTFYNDCPVLDADPDKRPTRLLLCDLTARTIKHGLSELLGIEVVDEM